MKATRPFAFALLAGLLTALPVFLIMQSTAWPPLAVAVAVLILSCLVTWILVRRIIFRRIRSIYQTIYKSYPDDHPAQAFPHSEDILQATEEEAVEWVKRRKEEIDQLQRMEMHRKEFLGNVSHELKTPIFNIQGYVTTLLDGGLEDKSIHYDYLKRSEKNVERLISIVEDLVDISQLETGELKLDKEKFDVMAMIRDVVEAQEFNAETRNITFHLVNDPEKSIVVNADKYRIRQVITNLVVNSVHYGRVNGKTTLKVSESGGLVQVEIADTGIGIAPEHVNRIFERFYRVDKSRSRELGGTGLGLSIVKHIIEAHGQTIRVTSKEGEGTTFVFTLSKE